MKLGSGGQHGGQHERQHERRRGRQRRGDRGRNAAVVVALALVAAACSSGDDAATEDEPAADAADGVESEVDGEDQLEEAPLPAAYQDYESEQYGDPLNWLCQRITAGDVCDRDLDATVVLADGSTEVQPHVRADEPEVDCFYVYPTVSLDEGPNSDLEPDEAGEIRAVLHQAARLSAACGVFAPVYRQIPVPMIGTGGGDAEVAYGDVLDAFRHYMSNENEGRGVVLVGHSQGANHLIRLIAEEIDDEPLLRDRLVAAYLLGWPVAVPEGEVVGGDFQNVPLCESTGQTGCVVSYASFRSTEPPPDDTLFGVVRDGEGRAACVNPASPEGGSATTQPYFEIAVPDEGSPLIGGTAPEQPFADEAQTAEITTPWVTYPAFIDVECVDDGEVSYLEVTVRGDPDDPRGDDIVGDLTPEWGLHLVDTNIAMGDLVDLATAQIAAYAG